MTKLRPELRGTVWRAVVLSSSWRAWPGTEPVIDYHPTWYPPTGRHRRQDSAKTILPDAGVLKQENPRLGRWSTESGLQEALFVNLQFVKNPLLKTLWA